MTIKQVIKELEREYNISLNKSKDQSNTMYAFYQGRASGLSNALTWLKYLNKKEG